MKQRSGLRFGLALCLGASLAIFAAISLADPPRGGITPDPPGIASKKAWVFDVSYGQGKASITRVNSVLLDQPTPTARVMGRFAIEFWVGKELLDRVRFDVPLLDDDPKNHRPGPFSGPRFGQVTTRIKARMADNPRATYVTLLDRGTGDVHRFWWPPEPDGRLLPMGAQGADAGAAPVDAAPLDAGGD
jgi:hypothetical protein